MEVEEILPVKKSGLSGRMGINPVSKRGLDFWLGDAVNFQMAIFQPNNH